MARASRWSRFWGVVLAAVLVAGGATAATPAYAAEPDLVLPAGNQGDTSFELEYGALFPASRVIAVGPDTTTLVMNPPFGPVSEEIQCAVGGPGGRYVTRTWSSAEWWAEPPDRTLSLETGWIIAGERYTASCSSRGEYSTSAAWTLVGAQSAPSQVTLGSALETATRFTERTPLDGGRDATGTPVGEGDRISIRGVPGTWFTPGGVVEVVANLEVSDADSYFETIGDDVVVAPDGSSVDFSIPLGINVVDARIAVRVVAVSRIAATATTPQYVDQRTWAATLPVVEPIEKVATTTSMTLDRRVGLSNKTKVKAKIVVRADDGDAIINGIVYVTVDGKRVATVGITSRGSAEVTVRLPLLARGVHSVVAAYQGSLGNLPSTSPTRRTWMVI